MEADMGLGLPSVESALKAATVRDGELFAEAEAVELQIASYNKQIREMKPQSDALSADVAAAHPDQVAAILPISGESQLQASATAIANNKTPVWDFHNSGDPIVNISISDNFIAWINAAHPAIPPKRTVFQSNQHDAWTKALDPSYKEFGMNVYEWLLQYAK
jgi:hypothetical protein